MCILFFAIELPCLQRKRLYVKIVYFHGKHEDLEKGKEYG